MSACLLISVVHYACLPGGSIIPAQSIRFVCQCHSLSHDDCSDALLCYKYVTVYRAMIVQYCSMVARCCTQCAAAAFLSSGPATSRVAARGRWDSPTVEGCVVTTLARPLAAVLHGTGSSVAHVSQFASAQLAIKLSRRPRPKFATPWLGKHVPSMQCYCTITA